MKKFEFNELIERAFSVGYECAQREFSNKENKEKKRAWEILQGEKRIPLFNKNKTKSSIADLIYLKKVRKALKNGSTLPQRVDIKVEDNDALVNLGRIGNNKSNNDIRYTASSINDVINQRANASDKNKLDIYNKDVLKTYKKAKEDDFYLDNTHFENRLGKLKKELKQELIKKKEQRLEDLKKIGAIIGGTAIIAGTAYGIKKYRDKKKEKRENKEED